eukprot:GILK01020916.1.p1 GENE.GILK01020916.1~~GILK01020916.1.p1  ORF type:complete len:165 (-),score=8.08 GILK01020916.1:341-835(-)
MYGYSADIWSAGCIFAEMIARKPIFAGRNPKDHLLRIFAVMGTPTPQNFLMMNVYPQSSTILPSVLQSVPGQRTFESWLESNNVRSIVRPEGIDLLLGMLQFDPAKRLNSVEVLGHPYFADIRKEIASKTGSQYLYVQNATTLDTATSKSDSDVDEASPQTTNL